MKFEYEDIVLSDKELGECVDNHMDTIGGDQIAEMIASICKEVKEREPGMLQKAPPIAKISYIGRELYKYGFVMALYYYNESMKVAFEEGKEKQ